MAHVLKREMPRLHTGTHLMLTSAKGRASAGHSMEAKGTGNISAPTLPHALLLGLAGPHEAWLGGEQGRQGILWQGKHVTPCSTLGPGQGATCILPNEMDWLWLED